MRCGASNTFRARIGGIVLFGPGPRAARSAFIAMLLEFVFGLVLCAVVFLVLASTATSLTDLVVMPGSGKPTPFVASLVLTAMVVVIQGGVGIALGQRHAWLRVVGILVALGIAAVCALFLGAFAIGLALDAATGRFRGGDVYDQIGVYVSLLPALAVLILNGRAAFFAARELMGRASV